MPSEVAPEVGDESALRKEPVEHGTTEGNPDDSGVVSGVRQIRGGGGQCGVDAVGIVFLGRVGDVESSPGTLERNYPLSARTPNRGSNPNTGGKTQKRTAR